MLLKIVLQRKEGSLTPKDLNKAMRTNRQIVKEIAKTSKLIDICVLRGNRVDAITYTHKYEQLHGELRNQLKA